MASQTTTASFPLLLDPQRNKDSASESLPELIRRINVDRGHLRNVTEDGLKEEIRKQQEPAEDTAAADAEQQTTQDAESRQKELYEAKMAMFQNVASAHEQAMLALDFLSFLIKKDAPQQADKTISPALKQMLPTGNLTWEKLPVPAPDSTEVGNDNLIAMGWSLQGLSKNADALLESAGKLERQVERETKYWDGVLSVREKGWSVCRVPRMKNTLAVRFGFSEATPAFNAQSMAVMRQDADGSVVLDQGLAKEPKAVRVRIFDGDQTIADSRFSSPLTSSGDISARIHQARDSLFEEELFYELTKEARTLLNFGVTLVDHAIRLPFSLEPSRRGSVPDSQRSILLTLEPVPSSSLSTAAQASNVEAANQARAVALSLRLLLTHTYRQRFHERSKPPPPLSGQRQPPKTSSILRPLLNYIQHQHATALISASLHAADAVLRAAQLDASTSTAQEALPAAPPHAPLVERVVARLSGPWRTALTLALPPARAITVSVATELGRPSFGSRYHVRVGAETETETDAPAPAPAVFASAADTLAHVNRLIRGALVQRLAAVSAGWSARAEAAAGVSELARGDDAPGPKGRCVLGFSDDGMVLAAQGRKTVWRRAGGQTAVGFDAAAGALDAAADE